MNGVLDPIKGFCGELIGPDHEAYDTARRVHNGLIDKRPALIARCSGVADVVDALALGRRHGLPIAIRGGGHNVAGRATVDAGIVIDLSPMKGVHVDPRARTARAQAGLTWAGFNRETQAHGLATTGGVVSTTGIAGLTLGGGIGWLMGRCGLTVDNLESVELVTADGQILTASADEHEDLFWALRGGGGNFGVATSFAYRLHPIGPEITGGIVAHPVARAREVLRFYREATAAAPDDLTMFAGLIHGPDGSKLAAIVCCHCGSLAEGRSATASIKRFGPPVLDTVGTMSYCDVNTLLDAAYPRGAFNYWKSSYLAGLSDEAIAAAVQCFERTSSPMSGILFEHVHGSAARVDPAATAFPHRQRGYNMLVLSQWMDTDGTEAGIAWGRDAYAALQPFAAAGRYVNYLGDEDAGAVESAFGTNYARLRNVKARYDPENVFRLNQNIPPAT